MSVKDQDWNELEAALGETLPIGIRTQVISLTNKFLAFAIFELTVEPLDGAKDRIKAVRTKAISFWKTLISGGMSDAAFYGTFLISSHFQDPRIGDDEKLRTLCGIMTSFVAACDKAQEQINSGNLGEHQPGERWKAWIVSVTKAFRNNDLPYEVRKDTDKNKSGRASPFVRFIERLQMCFDEKYRRGTASTAALAEAIVRARRVT